MNGIFQDGTSCKSCLVLLNRDPPARHLSGIIKLARELSLDDSAGQRDYAVLTFKLKREFSIFPGAGFDGGVTELRTAGAGDCLAFNLERERKRNGCPFASATPSQS